MSRIAVLIVAAGKGERAGPGLPKQYERLAGQADAAPDASRLSPAMPVQVVIGAGPGGTIAAAALAGLACPRRSPAARRGRIRCGWDWKRWRRTRPTLC